MYCEHCGAKIEDGAKFCQNCGKQFGADQIAKESTPFEAHAFYSKDWSQQYVFAIATLPQLDIMVDSKYFYLIKMPKYNSAATLAVLGFFLATIIGAAIGQAIGSARDAKKREWYRSAWVDNDNRVTSGHFENDILIRIPLEQLKGNIVFVKKKFTLTFGEKKYKLKKSIQEVDLLKGKIEKYVL